MSRPKGTNTVKETVYFSTEAFAVIKKFRSRYATRSISDITNAAVLYLAKQAGDFELNADCEPMNVQPFEQRMHEIAAEEAAVYHTREGTDKKKPPNKKEAKAS